MARYLHAMGGGEATVVRYFGGVGKPWECGYGIGWGGSTVSTCHGWK